MNRSDFRRLAALVALALPLSLALPPAAGAADPPSLPLHKMPAAPEPPAAPGAPACAPAAASAAAPACAPASAPAPAAAAPAGAALAAAASDDQPKPIVLGATDRKQVEAAVPAWLQVEAASTPDPQAAAALAAVAPGATVTIYLGSWCGDSRREVSRFWRALDVAAAPGAPAAGQPAGHPAGQPVAAAAALPFQIAYIAVDPAKREPAALVAGSDLRYVPTFIVQRGGREVGRIVESAPHGIERDLLALLDGTAHGVLSERTDLVAPPKP